ncbi:hypothetical protein [Asaia sp. HN128]|uniref:hypothetical protein n=1 Tax=Asaia sp. HN128 TaxID=3081234 RepID=UPI00301A3F24
MTFRIVQPDIAGHDGRDPGLQNQDQVIGRLFQIRPVEREDPAFSPVVAKGEQLAQPAPAGAVNRIGEQHAAI